MDALYRVGLRCAYLLLRLVWFIRRPNTLSAHVAVRWQGRVLFIRNSYKPHLSIPAGCFKRGETPAECAARELAEEVGIAVAPEDLELLLEFDSREDHKHDRCYFFGLQVEERPEVRIDRREVVWAEFLALDEVPREELTDPARQFLLHLDRQTS